MTIPAGYSKVRMNEFDAIVDVANNVVGMVDADGTEVWFAQQSTAADGSITQRPKNVTYRCQGYCNPNCT